MKTVFKVRFPHEDRMFDDPNLLVQWMIIDRISSVVVNGVLITTQYDDQGKPCILGLAAEIGHALEAD